MFLRDDARDGRWSRRRHPIRRRANRLRSRRRCGSRGVGLGRGPWRRADSSVVPTKAARVGHPDGSRHAWVHWGPEAPADPCECGSLTRPEFPSSGRLSNRCCSRSHPTDVAPHHTSTPGVGDHRCHQLKLRSSMISSVQFGPARISSERRSRARFRSQVGPSLPVRDSVAERSLRRVRHARPDVRFRARGPRFRALVWPSRGTCR